MESFFGRCLRELFFVSLLWLRKDA